MIYPSVATTLIDRVSSLEGQLQRANNLLEDLLNRLVAVETQVGLQQMPPPERTRL